MDKINIYAFGSWWDEKYESYFIKCKNEKFAFTGISRESKTYHNTQIKKGDIILLKEGITIKAIGIAEEDTGKPADFESINNGIFSIEEVKKYNIPNDCFALFVKVDAWRECNINYTRGAFLALNQNNINNRERIRQINQVLGIDMSKSEKNIEILTEKLLKSKNLILTGAPGTGKTYLARNIAASIILNKEVDNYKALNSEEKEIIKNQMEFVQFHPSYDYTDFVEGLKPNKDKSFERQDGIFKEFCKRALKNFTDSKKEPSEIEKEKIIQKDLEEFIDKVNGIINESNNPYPIVGLKKEYIKPISKIDYDDYKEQYIIYTLRGDNTSRKTILSTNKLIDIYIKYNNIKDKNYTVKELNKYLEITEHTSYIYGFYYAFDNEYGQKIQDEINNISHGSKRISMGNYVFIIDEINRGDINKILGELFYAIDPNYRGSDNRVKTQYNTLIIENEIDDFAEGFFIPENVYIIGTMNDIDRSVESMDFAIRRRFAWQEIEYSATARDMLNSLGDENLIEQIMQRLEKINYKISKILGSEYNIGASYFLKIKECNNNFKELWDSHLYGVLYEYFRGYEKVERNNFLQLLEDIVVTNEDIKE